MFVEVKEVEEEVFVIDGEEELEELLSHKEAELALRIEIAVIAISDVALRRSYLKALHNARRGLVGLPRADTVTLGG